jgi:hypothetical protein
VATAADTVYLFTYYRFICKLGRKKLDLISIKKGIHPDIREQENNVDRAKGTRTE